MTDSAKKQEEQHKQQWVKCSEADVHLISGEVDTFKTVKHTTQVRPIPNSDALIDYLFQAEDDTLYIYPRDMVFKLVLKPSLLHDAGTAVVKELK